MAWNDHLLAASFRGVPFFYDDTKRSGGRRLVEHEFPQRDDPYVEDLGRKKREHKIAGYVIGDDYIARRDALEIALDQNDFGTLLHPYRGELKVNIRSWTSQEVRDEGRMARFDIECVETGSEPSPLASLATAEMSQLAAGSSSAQLQISFIGDWLVGAGGTVAAAATLLDDLTSALAVLAGWPGVDTSAVAPLVEDLSDMATDGPSVADAVGGFFSGYAAAAIATQLPADETQSSRGLLPVPDPSYGLAGIVNWGATLSSAPGDQSGLNQDALVALVEGSAVVALGQIYARTEFAAQEDADAARDQLADLIDGLATTAADAGDDSGFSAWQALHQSATDDLTTRAKQAPSTIVFYLGTALPALMLAQRIYQDPARADELVARNDAPHPLFMPPNVQALTA